MLPPCHFLRYSSNIIVTLTEETNRLNHSEMLNRILYYQSLPSVTYIYPYKYMSLVGIEAVSVEE